MSLFDNLRYQNTNLGNRAELEALPEELINLYWAYAYSTTPEEKYNPAFTEKCRSLAAWVHNGSFSIHGRPYASRTFSKSLSEYNP